MDRRTLFAVALSFLFITVWMQVFGPKPPEPGDVADDVEALPSSRETRPEVAVPERPVAFDDPPPSSREVGAPTAAGSSEALAFATTGSAVDIRVETPLYTAVFSTRGGGMTLFVPRDYELESGDPLDLVPGDESQPVLVIDYDGEHGYAPLNMSDVVFEVRRESAHGLNISSLAFTAVSAGGVRVERRYVFHPEVYVIDTSFRVSGLPEVAEGRYELVWSAGLPVSEATVDMDLGEFGSLVKVGENLERQKLNHFSAAMSPDRYEGEVQWAASKTKYFISALIADDTRAGQASCFGDVAARRVGYSIGAPAAGGSATGRFALYVGPIHQVHLADLRASLPNADIDRHVGISTMPLGAFFGWFARLVYKAMTVLHSVVPNYGVVILLLALATKIIFFPLTRRSSQSMRAMSDLRPELDALRDKYKSDPQKMNSETFALYKKHGVNPVAGCLPLLIQMPVFMALYGVFRSAIELRQAPFVAWVNDLSAPDTLVDFGSLPMFPDALHVLPLLMSASTILMQRKAMTDPRQKSLMYLMPVMMLFFFYNLPSGLNLYWTSQNLLAWAEQSMTKGKKKPVTAKAA